MLIYKDFHQSMEGALPMTQPVFLCEGHLGIGFPPFRDKENRVVDETLCTYSMPRHLA